MGNCKDYSRHGECVMCGTGLNALSGMKRNQRKYCSRKCYRLASHQKAARVVKTCAGCQGQFPGTKRELYCSRECARKVARLRGAQPDNGPLWASGSPGSRGAFGELLVCVDLLQRGYDVYRNVSPNGARDLVASCGTRLISLQVRKAHQTAAGVVAYKKKAEEAGLVDHYAIYVVSTREVFYDPPLPV